MRDSRRDKTSSSRGKRVLPFSPLWPLLAGATAGIVIRLVFSGDPGEILSAMSGTFIFTAPVAVGAVTVLVAERLRRRSWGYYAAAGALANVLFVAGTLVILIEGWICAFLILPLFAALGAVAGVLAGTACRVTGWPRHTIQSFALLPMLLVFMDTRTPLPVTIHTIERSIQVEATPERLWREVLDVRDIEAGEVGHAWAFRIGVPLPRSGVSDAEEARRRIHMGRQVYFDQIVDEWREHEYVRWRYRFYQDSFPPGALDDHVVIGGHYFDLLDTSYELTPAESGTHLAIRATYRLSTRFNWYASPILRALIGNAAHVYLAMYRERAESQEGTATAMEMPAS